MFKKDDIKSFLKYIKDDNPVEFVDFRFTDLLGAQHHNTRCADAVDKDVMWMVLC